MIVSENSVEAALRYLSDDPHPLAKAKHDLTLAENKSRETYARCFLDAAGSVEARKAAAEITAEYVGAKEAEAEAIQELERHRSRVKAAEMVVEIWRTENANARAAERIR